MLQLNILLQNYLTFICVDKMIISEIIISEIIPSVKSLSVSEEIIFGKYNIINK